SSAVRAAASHSSAGPYPSGDLNGLSTMKKMTEPTTSSPHAASVSFSTCSWKKPALALGMVGLPSFAPVGTPNLARVGRRQDRLELLGDELLGNAPQEVTFEVDRQPGHRGRAVDIWRLDRIGRQGLECHTNRRIEVHPSQLAQDLRNGPNVHHDHQLHGNDEHCGAVVQPPERRREL